MSSIKEKFNQISPSEFFYSNRDLAGFSNPTRSLYTAVRELVENALDACDQKGILPDVHLIIKAVDPEKPDPKPYILTVKDNGPGIDSKYVPLAFGTILYGSKFGLKQARGMFGLGATMAILYGQITTNKPVIVKSSTDGKIQDEFEILLDIQKNKPIIVKHKTKEISKQGLSVSICLEGDYSKAGTKIRDYVYETSLITPYAKITFDDPKGEKFHHPRFVKDIPPPPTIIRPHPHGIDVERIRRMIVESLFEIPNIDDAMIEKVRKDLGLSKKNLGFTGIMEKARKKGKSLPRQTRVVIALMSFLKMDFEKLNKIRIEDIDVPNKEKEIKPNLVAKLAINDYESNDAILIPDNIIQENAKGEKFVFIISDKEGDQATVIRTKVTTGLSYDKTIEVTSGLKPGDVIVKDGAVTLRDGITVKIKETK